MAWKCGDCHKEENHRIMYFERRKCATCGRWAACMDCDNNGCNEVAEKKPSQ